MLFKIVLVLLCVTFALGYNNSAMCKSFKDDHCGCIYSDLCVLNYVKGTCEEADPNVQPICVTQNAYYALSSNKFCIGAKQLINCDRGKTVYAVNLNGKDYKADSGITFFGDGPKVHLSGFRLRQPLQINQEIVGVSAKDAESLYSSIVQGNLKHDNEGLCLSYRINLRQGGHFELNIKSTRIKNIINCYDIKINGVTAITTANTHLNQATNQTLATEIIITFYIDNQITKLSLYESCKEINIDYGFMLQFCYGGCRADAQNLTNSFSVSAFSLTRYGNGTEEDLNLQKIADCFKLNNNSDMCRAGGCEYDLEYNQCVPQIDGCANIKFAEHGNCVRENGTYWNATKMCKASWGRGSCSTGHTVHSANMFGDKYYWRKKYTHFVPDEFFWRQGLASRDPLFLKKRGDITTEQCSFSYYAATAEDILFRTLFRNYVTSKNKTAEGCITYPIPFKETGNYELTIWSIDPEYSEAGKRCFDVKLNNVTIMKSVDPFRIGKKRCAENELITFLKFDNKTSKLESLGFNIPWEVTAGTVDLNFCMGTCHAEDRSFLVNAFSLNRFPENFTRLEFDPMWNHFMQ